MRILLTNDDGIHASGLVALQRALRGEHEILVVAPEIERSAVGHAITLTSPLRVREAFDQGAFFGYAVRGTPADCVKIAVQELLRPAPDLVFSGINLGPNVGVNLLYSGTVSAATEGAFLGLPAAAISLDARQNPDFGFAAAFATRVVRFIAEYGLAPGTALNINIPALPPERIQGVAFTRQGTSRFREAFERRSDPRGNSYYWLAGEMPVEESRADTDARALQEGKISITPITYDLTALDELGRLRQLAPAAARLLGD